MTTIPVMKETLEFIKQTQFVLSQELCEVQKK